ncbi:MAG: peptidoglycan-binding protein [Candidatus Pacebacteria bacterium]|nr:peptidoglycan-binding protein [Candidatus Paceibacterota bacterium]
MQNFKFILVSLIVLVVIGFLGYWAIFTIEPGNVHADKQKQRDLEEQNTELTKQVNELQSQLASLQATQAEEAAQPKPETPTTPAVGMEEKPIKTPATTPTTTTSKNQTLINELQKLADDKVYMKVGSQGTRVGTVQNFLNLYNKTSTRIDNDYGATMKKNVAAFQKAQGITADGEAGPTTYLKMIAWLKK